MARGDHIRVYRTLYWHHGIDADDGTVIQLNAEPGRSTGARVQRTSLHEFLRGGEAEPVRHRRTLPPDEVVKRAESRIGETGYHLLFKNCEHFARWCVGRSPVSRQVENAAWQTAATGMVLRGAASLLVRRAAPRLAARALAGLGPVGLAIAAGGVAIGVASRVQARTQIFNIDFSGSRSKPLVQR